MDEKDPKSTVPTTATVIMVDQSTTNLHKSTDQDDPEDVHHKRSCTPIATSVSTLEMQKTNIVKELSSTADNPEATEMVLMVELDKKGTTTIHPAPPAISTSDIELDAAGGKAAPAAATPKRSLTKTEEEEITVDTGGQAAPETAPKATEWSDDEEAGALPRSGSRASRISRGVRQLFCCGLRYDAPSEDDISTHRFSGI